MKKILKKLISWIKSLFGKKATNTSSTVKEVEEILLLNPICLKNINDMNEGHQLYTLFIRRVNGVERDRLHLQKGNAGEAYNIAEAKNLTVGEISTAYSNTSNAAKSRGWKTFPPIFEVWSLNTIACPVDTSDLNIKEITGALTVGTTITATSAAKIDLQVSGVFSFGLIFNLNQGELEKTNKTFSYRLAYGNSATARLRCNVPASTGYIYDAQTGGQIISKYLIFNGDTATTTISFNELKKAVDENNNLDLLIKVYKN